MFFKLFLQLSCKLSGCHSALLTYFSAIVTSPQSDAPHTHPVIEAAFLRAYVWLFRLFIPLGAFVIIVGLGLQFLRGRVTIQGIAAITIYILGGALAFYGRRRWPVRTVAIFTSVWISIVIALAQLHMGPQMGAGAFWILVALLAQGFAGWSTTLWITLLMFTLTVTQGWLTVTGYMAPPFDMAAPTEIVPWIRVAVATGLAMICGGLIGRNVMQTLQESLAKADTEHQAREEADAARRRAEQTMEAQRHFEVLGKVAGGVAHDVNNSLTVVLTSAELLRISSDENEKRENLEGLRRGCQAATETTRQFLLLHERGMWQPQPTKVAEVGSKLHYTLKRVMTPSIELETSFESDRQVFVNPFDLQQAVLNLALNARDAMPEGGRCELRVENIELPDGRPGVAVRLRDTGVGITAEVRARVFEPFFTTKKPGEGTGLGLAMVQRFASDADGTVEVSSEPGKGSTFSILLPELTGMETTSDETPPVLTGAGQHLLLVDDHAEILNLGRRVLTSAGYRVTTARGITDTAKQLDRDQGFDLLCIDGSMTEQTSECDLLARFTEMYPGRPILTCSGRIENFGPPTTAKETRAAFLPKPYSPTELLTAIGMLLATRKTEN